MQLRIHRDDGQTRQCRLVQDEGLGVGLAGEGVQVAHLVERPQQLAFLLARQDDVAAAPARVEDLRDLRVPLPVADHHELRIRTLSHDELEGLTQQRKPLLRGDATHVDHQRARAARNRWRAGRQRIDAVRHHDQIRVRRQGTAPGGGLRRWRRHQVRRVQHLLAQPQQGRGGAAPVGEPHRRIA